MVRVVSALAFWLPWELGAPAEPVHSLAGNHGAHAEYPIVKMIQEVGRHLERWIPVMGSLTRAFGC